MSNHRTGLKRIWAALCAFAMCATVCVATGHAAFAKTATDDSNVVASLKYMSELNRLRQTNRARLTAQQIADAQNEDNGADMSADRVQSNAADGYTVPELKVNWDLMSWAQKRADALAERAVVDEDGPISHDDMYTGKPDWLDKHNLGENPDYQDGTYYFGPEALFIGYPETGLDDHNPIKSWYSELTAKPGSDRQGYGHYLTEVSPLADSAGMASAQVTSGRWKGATIVVLEIGYVGYRGGRGTNETVKEALERYVGTTYTVKYHANGGTGTMSDQKVEADSSFYLSNNHFTRIGYGFKGWNTKPDGSGTSYSEYDGIYNAVDPGETLDLYAQWTPNTYYVDFSSNNGWGGDRRSFTYDQAQKLPTPEEVGISKEHYKFSGWNTKDDGTGTSYQAGQSVKNLTTQPNGIVTLYAMWKQMYTVYFRAYDSVPEYSEEQQVLDGDTAKKPADPTRPGFVFRGWTAGYSNDSPLYDFSTPVTRNLYLYAQWNSYPYVIHYDANGGTGSMPDQKVGSSSSSNEATLKQNEFKYSGRVFTGWNTKRDGTGTAYQDNALHGDFDVTGANQVITLYAQWTTAKAKSIEVDKGTITCNDYFGCSAQLPSTVKVHLTDGNTVEAYVDWNRQQLSKVSDKKKGDIHVGDEFYIDSTNVVGFPGQKVRVKAVMNDTTPPVFNGVDDIAAKKGDTSFSTLSGISATDDHDGDVTSRIKVSGKFDINTPGDYPLTYMVKDAAGNETTANRTIHVTSGKVVTVSFNANGGTSSMSAQTFSVGDYQRFRSAGFTRVHYYLMSWNTKADGTGTSYDTYGAMFDESDVPANGKITLYAQWERATYYVGFYANLPNNGGGSAWQDIKYDEYANLQANTFTATGYTFVEWNTKADGSGTSYSDKQQVKNIYDEYGYGISLYAQWKANTYTVRFNANGGTGTMADQKLTYDKTEQLNRSTFKAPTGKMITGWNTKADGTGTKYGYCDPVKNLLASGSMTLYAQYGSAQYSSIVVKTPPTKVSYKTGETFDKAGLTVSAVQTNGDVTQLSGNEYTLSQPAIGSNGTKRVTVTLKSNTALKAWFEIAVGTSLPTVQESDSVENSDEAVMNYVVNLKKDTAGDVLDKAVAGAESLQAYKLMAYPEISVFFVQAHTKTFATDFAQWAAKNGIAVDSVAPTRDTLREEEIRSGSVASSEVASAPKWNSGNAFRKTQKDSSDPDTNIYDAWGIVATGADRAQRTDVAYKPTLDGVIDTGIEDDNPDLQGKVSSTYSVNCAANGIPQQGIDTSTGHPVWWPTDKGGQHGTHVSGTIAAAHNGTGVDGVNPNTTLAAIRVFEDKWAYTEQEVCGYMWAANVSMDVTNASLGNNTPVYPSESADAKAHATALQRAVSYANKRNVTNIASAMNSGLDLDNLHKTKSGSRMRRLVEKHQPPKATVQTGDTIDVADKAAKDNAFDPADGLAETQVQGLAVNSGTTFPTDKGYIFPAMLDGIITVSSVRKQSNHSVAALNRSVDTSHYDSTECGDSDNGWCSNYGVNTIDVTAPGSNIYSTYGTDYQYMSGTSMASPHVAGVVSLLKSVHPDYSPAQIEKLLKKQAKELYGNLVAPTDGAEYRGAGLVNAYAAVMEDQEKPVVSAQYSTDGGSTWRSLANAKVPGKATIRVTVTGPVSSASMSFGGQTKQVRDGDNYHGNVSMTMDVDFSKLTSLQSELLAIKAYGLNYSVSNDDVNTTVQFQGGQFVNVAVSFDSNGGSVVSSQQVKYGSKVVKPADPTRSGYTFDGWYTAKSGGSKYDFNQPVTGALTLYAHWTVNSYTLTFDANGGKVSPASRKVRYGAKYGDLPTPTRSGYTFDGWCTAKSGGSKVSGDAVMGAGDVTVYARWAESPRPSSVVMHRLYNRYTGEHFYTSDVSERDRLVSVGWSYEGVGWVAPVSGDPVYRLYNGHVRGGDHHYTTSASERDSLVRAGWSYEGVGWRSGGSVPVYRQYNPYARTGTHNYTADGSENDRLVSVGWRAEGVGWYAVSAK